MSTLVLLLVWFRFFLVLVALLARALGQRIVLMSSLMLRLVWLRVLMVPIKLFLILGTMSGKTVKLLVSALMCRGNIRRDRNPADEQQAVALGEGFIGAQWL